MTKCIKCEHPSEVKSGTYTGLCRRCRRKQYYADHKESERKLCHRWYQKHRDSEIQKNTEYRKQNRELFDWYHNKDRFSGLRKVILERDSNQCQICKTLEKLVIHHIDGQGYKSVNKTAVNNDIENLITLCAPCHTALHHWQRQNKQLTSREDIVRTLVKAREALRNVVPRRRSFLRVTN